MIIAIFTALLITGDSEKLSSASNACDMKRIKHNNSERAGSPVACQESQVHFKVFAVSGLTLV